MKSEQGITLTVLVITIIVLLILSSATVSLVIGEGSMLSKSEDISYSIETEQIISSVKADISIALKDGYLTQEELEEILESYGTVVKNTSNEITGLEAEDLVDVIDIADLYDGKIATDITAPTASIVLGATSVEIDTEITATVTHEDTESEINIERCKYIYNTTSESLGTKSTTWNDATSFTENSQTIKLSASEEGVYYLHVLSVDAEGNKAETISEAVTVTR